MNILTNICGQKKGWEVRGGNKANIYVRVRHLQWKWMSLMRNSRLDAQWPQFAVSFAKVQSHFLLYFSGRPGSGFGPNRDLRWQGFPADRLRKVNRRNLEQWHPRSGYQWPVRAQRVWSLHADLLPPSAKQIIEVGNPLSITRREYIMSEMLETVENLSCLHCLFKYLHIKLLCCFKWWCWNNLVKI